MKIIDQSIVRTNIQSVRKVQRQLKNSKQCYHTLRMPDCGRFYGSVLKRCDTTIVSFSSSLSLSFRIHRKLICRENCFFDVNTMRQIDKLSGSDDRPFCRWKISIVECFDVHESLLLMLSSQTGFNASPLSIARLECATTFPSVSITSSVRGDVHRETYSFVIIK